MTKFNFKKFLTDNGFRKDEHTKAWVRGNVAVGFKRVTGLNHKVAVVFTLNNEFRAESVVERFGEADREGINAMVANLKKAFGRYSS